ncbi:MAG: hypothetical protein ACJAZ2_000378 [Glaciecola sp.]|jgi:hypothetical protein
MKLITLFFFLILIGFTSCEDDEELKLTTPKGNYIGSLRTNGYYYLTISNDTENRALCYMLYRDGTLLYGGAPLVADVAAREVEYTSGSWDISAKAEKTFWGIFQTTGSNILFDQWYIRDGGLLASYQTSGTILNDTTFIMSSSTREGLSGVLLEEVYHFKALTSKPDSVNQFLD